MKPNKPLGRKAYGSIPHLLGSKLGEHDKYIHEGQHRICTEKFRDKHDWLIVTEKYDGSNVSVARKDGKILPLTRSGYLAQTSPFKQHHLFAKWVKFHEGEFLTILDEGERLCGEWMLQKHGIEYQGIDWIEDLVVFFDHFDCENKRKPFFKMVERIEDYGFNTPNLIHIGSPISIREAWSKRLSDTSDWPPNCTTPEGMVFRVERKGEFDFMAKWVRDDFESGKYLPGIGLPEGAEPIWNNIPEVIIKHLIDGSSAPK